MALDNPSQSEKINTQLEALESILEQEFRALKNQDMDEFDRLQARKIKLIELLGSETVVETIKSRGSGSTTIKDNETESLASIKLRIERCHELHRRNEILINRKLEAVKGALSSLREGNHTDEVEVYTKAGGFQKSNAARPIKKT